MEKAESLNIPLCYDDDDDYDDDCDEDGNDDDGGDGGNDGDDDLSFTRHYTLSMQK